MELIPKIFTARVMHNRLFPKNNKFSYNVYYLALPLPSSPLPSRVLSFHEKDHGAHDGSDIQLWARKILDDYDLGKHVEAIIFVTMPRVLGYVFNPVSFFLCLDKARELRGVICEVHNTFGERHNYLCAKADHSPITAHEWLKADKLFHVSPFLPREGYYQFKFALTDNRLGIWIDYYDKTQKKQLITSLTGALIPLDAKSLRRVFWKHPLVTLKVIILIHWQAAKLFATRIKYITKPSQRDKIISTTHDLHKNNQDRNDLESK